MLGVALPRVKAVVLGSRCSLGLFVRVRWFSIGRFIRLLLLLIPPTSLPFMSPSLARAGKILSPPGGLGPLDIVAELAALDGLKDHTKSVRALEEARNTDEHRGGGGSQGFKDECDPGRDIG